MFCRVMSVLVILAAVGFATFIGAAVADLASERYRGIEFSIAVAGSAFAIVMLLAMVSLETFWTGRRHRDP